MQWNYLKTIYFLKAELIWIKTIEIKKSHLLFLASDSLSLSLWGVLESNQWPLACQSDRMNAYPIDKKILISKENSRTLIEPVGDKLVTDIELYLKMSHYSSHKLHKPKGAGTMSMEERVKSSHWKWKLFGFLRIILKGIFYILSGINHKKTVDFIEFIL